MSSQTRDNGLTLSIDYPNESSRPHLLLKTFLGWLYVGFPHGIILGLYGAIVGIVTVIAFFAILITGRYPQSMFNFAVGYHRWRTRVVVYMAYMTDKYPPFSIDAIHPVELVVQYPEQVSKLKVLARVFLGWLYVQVPHQICLFFYGIAVSFVIFIGWWSILLFGSFPQAFFGFAEGYLRWQMRVSLYSGFITDRYPPFNGRP